LISNVLADSVDLVMRQALSADQALQVKEQWRNGTVTIAADGWVVIYPQMVNPSPSVVLNPDFRRALLYALDRQQLADSLMAGLVPVADSVLHPDTPEGQATLGNVVRYAHDPQRATRLIEGLGFSKGADGLFRDAGGQRLAFETRATAQRDIHVKTMLPVVDAWQRLGLSVETQVIPAQRATDREEQATFPAFMVLRQPGGLERMVALPSAEARLPERNFVGSNNGRYMNPELDALIDRYLVTIPRGERLQITGQIVHHFSDQLPVLGLFFDATPALVHNRLQGVTPLTGSEDGRQAWNSYEWSVR
jgi:peptide/nickel transport system substrate-binding protein